MLAIDGMRRVRCDECQFGMTSVDDAGNLGPARKATGFMMNDEHIAEAVNRRCFGGRKFVTSISHDWWRRYCVPCDRACGLRDAAKRKGGMFNDVRKNDHPYQMLNWRCIFHFSPEPHIAFCHMFVHPLFPLFEPHIQKMGHFCPSSPLCL